MSCSRGVAAPRTALCYGAPFGLRVHTSPETASPRAEAGVVPNPAALLRPADSLLVEAHDEWQVADKTLPFGIHPGLAQRTQRPIPAKRCSSWGADGTVKTPQSFVSKAPLALACFSQRYAALWKLWLACRPQRARSRGRQD